MSPQSAQPPQSVQPPQPVQQCSDEGSATAEYAIATMAACGFAALLLAILTSGEVRSALLGIITRALNLAG